MSDRNAMASNALAALECGAKLSAAERNAAIEALRQVIKLPASASDQADALFIECRRKFFDDRSARAAAHEIATGLNRYFTSAWRRGDRLAHSCPDRIANSVDGAYWRILKVAPRTVSSEYIRKIVGF